ncbi:zinc finger protein 235-like isoform X7 [Myripristis murdjan]|uniref:zinc finger protein 235-like isoform X7 n=1 Tax=Myripristis murdjan TaxID=586833 RepID=UPI0011762575|nr:zinc finger protein 235-like isoform X7 [Myripristis murdjan]
MSNSAEMSSVQTLRTFVNQRLTAAAEEICGVFEQTLLVYEEEIERQRRLLDVVLKPEIRLHRIDHPQPPVCKQEPLLDKQHCKLEDNSSLGLEVPQIKEEQKELCTGREREQPLVQEEEDVFRLTPDGSDHSDHQSQHSELCQTWSAEEEEPVGNISFKMTQSEADGEGSGVSNSERRLRFHSHRVAESEGSKPSSCGSAGSAQSTEPQQQSRAPEHDSCSKEFSDMKKLQTYPGNHTGKEFLRCRVCGKGFKVLSVFKEHVRIHTKLFSCSTCGKVFSFKGNLKRHMMIHTGERPYSCTTCDKTYTCTSHLKAHMMTHTGERPYSCTTCDKTFIRHSHLKTHMMIHTGEKPYSCTTCDKTFILRSLLKRHMLTHKGERP